MYRLMIKCISASFKGGFLVPKNRQKQYDLRQNGWKMIKYNGCKPRKFTFLNLYKKHKNAKRNN